MLWYLTKLAGYEVEELKAFTNAVAGVILYPVILVSCLVNLRLAMAVSTFAALGSLGLGTILLTKLGEFCPVCCSIYLCNFLLFFMIWRMQPQKRKQQ